MGYRFTYPDYGPDTSFQEHLNHSGQECSIIRELGDDERDLEVGRMFVVQFSDGVQLQVFADELRKV